MATKKLTYKDMDINDIIEYCKAHGEIEWLKETAAKEVPCKKYPRKTVPVLDENGNQVYTAKGKPKTKAIADKSAKPTMEMRPITFIQIKNEFCEKFMPELMPKAKAKAPTMYDIIKAL